MLSADALFKSATTTSILKPFQCYLCGSVRYEWCTFIWWASVCVLSVKHLCLVMPVRCFAFQNMYACGFKVVCLFNASANVTAMKLHIAHPLTRSLTTLMTKRSNPKNWVTTYLMGDVFDTYNVHFSFVSVAKRNLLCNSSSMGVIAIAIPRKCAHPMNTHTHAYPHTQTIRWDSSEWSETWLITLFRSGTQI